MALGTYNGHSGEKRERVQRWLETQWTAGYVARPSCCIVCGQTEGAIHAHLEDYDAPWSYVELCITCHLVLHSRFRRKPVWFEYLAQVSAGWQAPPLAQRAGFTTLAAGILANRWPTGLQRAAAPGRTFLDELEPARPQELALVGAPS
jgi:hypothetical protein